MPENSLRKSIVFSFLLDDSVYLCFMSFQSIFPFLILLGIFCSCSTNAEVSTEKGESKVRYADHFEILITRGNVLLHIKNPDNQQIERRFFVQRTSETAPPGYVEIRKPIESIIALSSTHIGMLEALKSTETVVGISSHLYVHDATVLKNYAKNKVLEMGEEGSIPFESIVASKAEVLIYSGFTKIFPHENQLESIGIHCIPNYDWREGHPLGKAEWIKFFGYLIGKEKEANRYFDQVVAEYKGLKEIANSSLSKPSLFSGNMVGDVWHSPAGQSYNAIFFKDAQGRYIYEKTKGTGSIDKSFEQILVDNRSTDIWMNPGYASKRELIAFQPKFRYFESYQNDRVYNYSYAGNRFWEKSAVEPQHVLSDLIHILHPELKEIDTFYFYRKLD
jgi:iron complex transport system substrate-binding protein